MSKTNGRVRGLLLFAILFATETATAQTSAFTGVAIIDVVEGVTRPGMTVVVMGGRIAKIGRTGDVKLPPGATVIEGRGKYLIPGLWDMHVHTSSDRITREILYPLFIAHGVTGVRNMRVDCFEEGRSACGTVDSSIEQARKRHREIESGKLVGPRVVAGSAFADGPGLDGVSTVQGAATAEHARAFVRLEQERGVDFIKVYDMIPREAYFALADEANRVGIPFAGHVPVAVRASEASDAGQRSFEHAPGGGNMLEECSAREDELRPRVVAELGSDEPEMLPLMLAMVESYDPEKCAAVFDRLIENGTWITPTLMTDRLTNEVRAGWREDARMRYLPPEERAMFTALDEEAVATYDGDAESPYTHWVRRMTGAMSRAGVRLLAGSDAGDAGIFWGSSLHEELGLLVSAGLTEAEALRAATISPAEYLAATDSLGAVEEGKLADLVLLAANPLEDIANTQRIEAVVARGRLFDREALDALLVNVEVAAQK